MDDIEQIAITDINKTEKHRIIFKDKISGWDVCHGSLIINYRPEIKENPVGFIEDVWTHENFRKRGLGRTLVKQLIDAAKMCGCYKVVLYCNDGNVPFYEKIGFAKWQNGMRFDL